LPAIIDERRRIGARAQERREHHREHCSPLMSVSLDAALGH
jgi:hypothetical protein